jgi:hypothetical protein
MKQVRLNLLFTHLATTTGQGQESRVKTPTSAAAPLKSKFLSVAAPQAHFWGKVV